MGRPSVDDDHSIVAKSSSEDKKLATSNLKSATSKPTRQANLSPNRQSIKRSSRGLTVCLLCLVAANLSLWPYLSLHLTERIGLLLFEADLVQLRSSQISCAACLLFIGLISAFVVISNHCDRRWNPRELLPKISRKLIPSAAIVSSLAYLSIVLLIPHIKQVQRLPLATFDCDANLITIENCPRSYTARGVQALSYILLGGFDYEPQSDGNLGGGERLIRDLNCLRYNDESLKSVQVPTNFLLHSCGLVCRPQRQHYHQFGDDLNSLNESKPVEQEHPNTGQVSLKVCFSDEIGGSNYKQYCITNLADQRQQQQQQQQRKQDDKTLTLGQLSALLRKGTPSIIRHSATRQDDYDSTYSEMAADSSASPTAALSSANDDQATHYVNPIVQFESHFKNWPYLSNKQQNFDDSSTNVGSSRDGHDGGWCQFRPIPPFIVNNKPFSEIKCSIEHEYTMTTGSLQADRIFLKKSTPAADLIGADARNERCNIQCKVNILYQIRVGQPQSPAAQPQESSARQHYYLPLKSCNMISGESKKATIIKQCVIFKSIGDSALIICLILIDLLLLVESMDSKRFYLEQDKSRFLGILLIVLLLPLLVALQFDLIQWDQMGSGYLGRFFNEDLMLYYNQLSRRLQGIPTPSSEAPPATNTNTTFHFDNYLVPVLNFTIIIFVLSVSSRNLHGSKSSSAQSGMSRLSSMEELGMAATAKRSVSPEPPKETSNSILPTRLASNRGRLTLETLLFTLVSLVLGTQFYLSLTVQSLILRETFGSSWTGKRYPASWFEFVTHTGPALLVATLAFLFRNEMSAFFANFSPLTSCPANADELACNKNRAKFLKYICLALAIYSLRSLLLSNLTKESRIKFPIVFLYHLSELFNFPLVWFALCRRAHELLIQPWMDKQTHPTTRRSERALEGHLTVQAGLGFVYFVVARLVALTLHSLNVGLHLHSDSVDWFITGLQRQSRQTHQLADTIHGQQNDNSTIAGDISDTAGSDNNNNGGHFSPLPSERQTYLHASRLFLKYNSLLCLLMATLLGAYFLSVKYQIWSHQKRTLHVEQRAAISARNDEDDMNEFDQQLGLDLMQVRHNESRPPTSTRLIYPSDISNRSETSTSRADTPRARVLFHYQLDRDKRASNCSRSPSASSSGSSQISTVPSPPIEAPVVRVIAVDRDSDCHVGRDSPLSHQQTTAADKGGQEIESTSNYRNKTVRIQEEEIPIPESWQETGRGRNNERAGQPRERKRTISFAPEATFIGAGQRAATQHREHTKSYTTQVRSTRTIRTATPEPSIDGSGSSD